MKRSKYVKSENDGTFIKPLETKNSSQDFYIDMLRESTITLCTGPAGTGKTYLAAYVAIEALINGDVDKIVLTRPIVACEDIGYLPGDMLEKVHPYLLPLIDAVESHLGVTKTKEFFNFGKIEILPLAYMRGRSLNRAFIILDEAQNCTQEQIKMFLTRLGYDSKIVVNGDASQSDLPRGQENGLSWGVKKLRGVDGGISVVEFSAQNIVRHPLIAKMLQYLEGPSVKERHEFYHVEKLNGSASLTAAQSRVA